MSAKHTVPQVQLLGDESGHSGANLLKKDEPVLTYALVRIDRPADETNAFLAKLLTEVQAKELKWKNLHDNTNGLRVVEKMVDYLDSHGAVVYPLIAEKRFLVAALVIETFLDGRLNPQAPPQDAGELRTELANLVLEVMQDRELEPFVEGLRHKKNELVIAFGESFAARLALHHQDHVRFAGRAIASGVKTPYWFNAAPDGAPPKFGNLNPLVHSLLPFLSAIDKHLAKTNEVAEIVSDEDTHFGALKKFAFAHLKDSNHLEAYREFGVVSPLPHIAGLREASDSTEPRLQLADVVAGVLRVVTEQRLAGSDATGALKNIWLRVHSCMLRSQGHGYVALSAPAWAKAPISK